MPKQKTDGGWLLPAIIDPPERKAVCICIPEEENHVAAFWGALNELGYWFNWQRDPDKKGLPVSLVWARIVSEAHQKWLDGVMCTSCEELIECLQPLIDEINAKLDSIQSGVNTLQFGAGNSPAGEPLSEEQLEENQAGTSNPTCDLDILWAQCKQLVQYTHQLILDALEAAEAATNSLEFMEVLTGLPGIDEVGADVVAGYIQLIQDGITENYAAEATEAKLEEIACAIFCACKGDCEITINRVNVVYRELVEPFFGDLPATFSTIGAFMSYFVDQNIGSDVIVYLLQWMIWEGGALANIFLGDIGTKPLQTLLLLAVDDASSDWELLCEECAEETCYDTGSIYADIVSGAWVDDPPNMRFARAAALGDAAEFEIAFGMDVELVQFTYQSQTLSGSGFTNNTGQCELWLDGALVLTVFSFNRPNDGGYVWSTNSSVNAIDSTTGAGTVFDTIKFRHQHASRIADVRGEVCVIAV